jgi:hypothetical protein
VKDTEACYVESLEEDLRYMGVGIPGETRSYGEENGGLVLGAPKLEVIEEDVFPDSFGLCPVADVTISERP